MSDDEKRRLPMAPKSLPMQWRSGNNVINDRAAVVADGPSQIVSASDADLIAFAQQNSKTCGSCKFLRAQRQDRPEVSGFLATAIYEAKWKLGWLAPDPKDLRRCEMNEGLAVSPQSKACDQHREGSGRVR